LAASGRRALLWAVAVTSTNALLFWTVAGLDGRSTVVSFWNRSFAERALITVLYVLLSARILIWYHDRLVLYAAARQRSAVRMLPLAFGLAVFGSTLTWWLTVAAAIPTIEIYRALFRGVPLQWNIVLLPFSYFVQLLFLSRSTLVWFVAAGITWPLASILPFSGRLLSSYYAVPAGQRAIPPLWLLKVWNVFGYLVFLLSLLFQSG
jgi:hypothetical protein